MILTRYSTDRDVQALNRQVDRLLHEILPVPARSLYSPTVEVSETENSIEVKVELPGIDVNNVEIQVTKELVSIRGERKRPEGTPVSEFRYGQFGRSIVLPAKVQNTAVTADYRDGILYLTLPKAEEEKNKVVKVQLTKE
ncbi:Hsp20/alpha crystallin family protein [Pannus brasiliensis CCIBt3594]|uniref:Hsp20/alpha crystallin family protein n=1 Tax=Pannus brasiliensis CCIBt3594 TaxID=1427578 RepID=A0AAW9QXJ1_9CHRO